MKRLEEYKERLFMNIEKDYSFTVMDENGIETICDTLSVINIEGENPLMVYTDYSLDQDGKFNLYVSKIIKDNDDLKLEKIDDYSIIPEIQKEIERINNQINNN
jgi:uncharacterized protein YrzB (UPF0473 family)